MSSLFGSLSLQRNFMSTQHQMVQERMDRQCKERIGIKVIYLLGRAKVRAKLQPGQVPLHEITPNYKPRPDMQAGAATYVV